MFATYSYDGLSRRDGLTYGNGRVASYSYNPDSTLQQIKHAGLINDAGVMKDAVWGFAYNAANQVTEKTSPPAFKWTPASSGVGVFTYTPTGLNQYQQIKAGAATATPLSYDTNGNLTGDGARWCYKYDTENRMISAKEKQPAPNCTSGVEVFRATSTYSYDPLERRYSKTVNAVRTDYLWAGQNIVAEYAVPNIASPATQSLQRRYVFGPGVDEPVAMLTYNGAATPVLTDIQYYHADHAGTVVAMSGGLSGSALSIYGKLSGAPYKYSVYGEADPSNSGNIFRFTGRQLDPETGLYYYRARMYNPALGRFMQTDPAGDTDHLNLYQYALWDPIMNKDPSGKVVPLIVWGAITAIGTGGVAGGGFNLVRQSMDTASFNLKSFLIDTGIGAAAGGLTFATGWAAAPLAVGQGLAVRSLVGATQTIADGIITGELAEYGSQLKGESKAASDQASVLGLLFGGGASTVKQLGQLGAKKAGAAAGLVTGASEFAAEFVNETPTVNQFIMGLKENSLRGGPETPPDSRNRPEYCSVYPMNCDVQK